jgi:ATP-dependent exoDNAse (exonuclease V) beta subunit
MEDFLFGLRASGREGRGVYFYREFRERFTDVWNGFVEEFFKSVGFVPLYEFMVTVLGKFRVMENFPEYQGFSMKFLELIKAKEEDYAGVSSFLEFFESIGEKELYVNVIHTDSVKIMTIHKAKGLEFPVVIVPFLEMEVKIGSGAPGRRKSYVVKRCEDNKLNLVQLRKEYLPYSERLAGEYRDEYVRSLIDELDSLYVVLTRAQYEMYLFIPKKAGSSKNIARVLMPFETRQCGTPRTGREYDRCPVGEEKPPFVLPVSRYSDWIGVLKDEFMGSSQLINRKKILRGEVLHFILSCVGNLCTCDRDECLTGAEEKARLAFPHIGDLVEYVSVVRTLLEDEKFERFFYVREGELFREKEVVDSSGNTKRIDRLIVMPGEMWVIDYKSSDTESETHREQIIEYMNILSSLYPELKARAFLIYLDTLTVEEVDG